MDGVADVNGDGKSDILVGTVSGQTSLHLQRLGQLQHRHRADDDHHRPGLGRFRSPVHRRRRHRRRRQGRLRDLGAAARQRQDLHLQGPRGVERRPTTPTPTPTTSSISAPTYAATQLGGSMARLGDFNGDGVDDFAVGAFGYNGGRGRVVVILGRSGFSAANLNVHDHRRRSGLSVSGTPSRWSVRRIIVGMGRLYAEHVGDDAGGGRRRRGHQLVAGASTRSTGFLERRRDQCDQRRQLRRGTGRHRQLRNDHWPRRRHSRACPASRSALVARRHDRATASSISTIGSTIAGPFSASPVAIHRFAGDAGTAISLDASLVAARSRAHRLRSR